jgi:hypothetical protein
MVWLLWTVDPSAGEYTLGEAVLVRAPDVIHDLVATVFLDGLSDTRRDHSASEPDGSSGTTQTGVLDDPERLSDYSQIMDLEMVVQVRRFNQVLPG